MDSDLLALANANHGLLTLAAVQAMGRDPRLLARLESRGVLERVHPGVYRVAGIPPSWQQRLRGATLWAGDGAVASHLSAAAELGLCDRPSTIHVTAARRLHPLPPCVTLHQRGPVPHEDVTEVDGIPMTTMPRTIVDLAQVTSLGRLEP